MDGNSGQPFDDLILQCHPTWLNEAAIETAAEKYAQYVQNVAKLQPDVRRAWLMKAIEMMDLTTLSGDEFPRTVKRLCERALQPLDEKLVRKLGWKSLGFRLNVTF